MKKFASFVMIAAVGLVSSGCSLLGFGGGGGGSDMAKMMADSAQAPWQIGLHSGAEVGQWASWEASGSTQWWGVTGEKDGNLVVEMRMSVGAGMITYAYVCDAEGNVAEAYVANYDPEAEELSEGHKIKIMEKTDAPAGDGPEPETGEETVNAAGKDWACKWVKVDAGGKPATSWMSDDMWFNKLIKSEYDGNVSMMLKEIGTDAKLGLKFPEGGE